MKMPEDSCLMRHSDLHQDDGRYDASLKLLAEATALGKGLADGFSQRIAEAEAHPLAIVTELGGSLAGGLLLSSTSPEFTQVAGRIIGGAIGLSCLQETLRHLFGLTGNDKTSAGDSVGRWLFDTVSMSVSGVLAARVGAYLHTPINLGGKLREVCSKSRLLLAGTVDQLDIGIKRLSTAFTPALAIAGIPMSVPVEPFANPVKPSQFAEVRAQSSVNEPVMVAPGEVDALTKPLESPLPETRKGNNSVDVVDDSSMRSETSQGYTSAELALLVTPRNLASSPFGKSHDVSLFEAEPAMIPDERPGQYLEHDRLFMRSLEKHFKSGDIDANTLLVAVTGHGAAIAHAMALQFGSDVFMWYPHDAVLPDGNIKRIMQQARTFFPGINANSERRGSSTVLIADSHDDAVIPQNVIESLPSALDLSKMGITKVFFGWERSPFAGGPEPLMDWRVTRTRPIDQLAAWLLEMKNAGVVVLRDGLDLRPIQDEPRRETGWLYQDQRRAEFRWVQPAISEETKRRLHKILTEVPNLARNSSEPMG